MLALALSLALNVQTAPPENYLAIGHIQGPGVLVLLRDQQGICPEGSKMALMIGTAQPIFWYGCWSFDGQKVKTTWEDGDKIEIPAEAIQWRTGKKPTGV